MLLSVVRVFMGFNGEAFCCRYAFVTFKSEKQCSAALERTKGGHPIVVLPAKKSPLFEATKGLICCLLFICHSEILLSY